MPRETIKAGDHDVEIGWPTEQLGYVQVATVRPDSTRRVLERLREAGYSVVPTEEREFDYDLLGLAEAIDLRVLPPDRFDGWRAELDQREQVNRLIRALQRARDGAFGKDA
jgi:hypothetical protein